MDGNESLTNNEEVDMASKNFDRLKVILDFQYDAIKEATSILEKGFSFYLIILAATLGFVMTHAKDLNESFIGFYMMSVIMITFFVSICVCVMSWGVYSGLKDLKQTIKLISAELWDITTIKAFLNRGIFSTMIIGVFGSLSVIIILIFSFNIKSIYSHSNSVKENKYESHRDEIKNESQDSLYNLK